MFVTPFTFCYNLQCINVSMVFVSILTEYCMYLCSVFNFLHFSTSFSHLYVISLWNAKTIPNDIWYRDLIIWARFFFLLNSFHFNVIFVAFYFSFTLLENSTILCVDWDLFGLDMITALLLFFPIENIDFFFFD